MGIVFKWQEELIAIAWINIALIVMSLPLFSIYIVESLEGENVENFMLHTQRGEHFVEIIAKYLVSIVIWIPMSILLKIGATKPSYTLIKACSVGTFLFVFILALQLVLKPPTSTLVACAYGISFLYLMSTVWIMKNFAEQLGPVKDDLTHALSDSINGDTISNGENLDELNDVADQRIAFRLQQLSRNTNLVTKL